MNFLKEALPSFAWRKSGALLKTELLGGVVGALIAIPQGVIFSYLAGVPAEFGIQCAIWVTALASLFGNSIVMSGPNTATAILIGTSVIQFAGRGSPLYIDYVMLLTFLVGVIQLLFWIFRTAKFFHLLAPAASVGISVGVGFQIVLSSLDGLLGISPIETSFFYEKLMVLARSWNDLVNPWALVIGLITVISALLTQKRLAKYSRFIIFAILVGALAGGIVNGIWPQSRTDLEFLGRLHLLGGELRPPKLYADYLLAAFQLLPAAFAIAFLSLSQTLVIAKSLKDRMQPELNLNKEIFAIGFANFVGSFFFAFAGSGSFNRTQVSEQMKVRSPLAGVVTGLSIFLIIYFAGDLFRFLPMPVVAGVLLVTGSQMVKWQILKAIAAKPTELIVFLVVFLSILFLGLSEGIIAAVGISIWRALVKANAFQPQRA